MPKRFSAVWFIISMERARYFGTNFVSFHDVLYYFLRSSLNKLSVSGWSLEHNTLHSSFLSGWTISSLRRLTGHNTQKAWALDCPLRVLCVTSPIGADLPPFFLAFNNRSSCWSCHNGFTYQRLGLLKADILSPNFSVLVSPDFAVHFWRDQISNVFWSAVLLGNFLDFFVVKFSPHAVVCDFR